MLMLPVGFVSGQVSIKDSSILVPMVYGFYGYQSPAGDMADRFGGNSAVGPGVQFKLKSGFMFGMEYNFLWGNRVKNADQILSNLLTADGQVISMEGTYALFDLFERGYTVTGHVGKLFPVLSPNPNSGFFVKVGAGYMQHWIRAQVKDVSVPWLDGDYEKGYDRLSAGFMVNEFVGYMYLSNTRLLNFYVGLEFIQAWTRSQREVNFDSGMKDDAARFDALNGLKIGWIIPIYKRTPEEFYYY